MPLTMIKSGQTVALQEAPQGWQVLVGGAPLCTPARHTLHMPVRSLAEALAQEWQAEKPNPARMPLTRLATIAHDIVPQNRTVLLADTGRYAETDLLCYRTSDATHALRQAAHFEPVLRWAYDTYGLLFHTTEEALPVVQPERTLEGVRALIERANDWELAALAMATPILGSVVLSLALWDGSIDAEAAVAAARLDETMQAERYGEDDETEARWREKASDVRACAKILVETIGY